MSFDNDPQPLTRRHSHERKRYTQLNISLNRDSAAD